MQILARGRIAHWSREKIDTLSTLELRQLLANAQRLHETEIAALCNELLGARPRGHGVVRRQKPKGKAGAPVARGRATE